MRGFAFQQRLGAYFCAMAVSQRPMDEALGLGPSIPVSVRLETEAPVDDILVGTSANGYVAVQVKTSLSLSSVLDSRFGSSILQFVRHWLACHEGGTRSWQRMLNPETDRLVLAVGTYAPRTIRIDLPSALRNLAVGVSVPLSGRQKRAAKCFAACVEQAWRSSTTEAFDLAFVGLLARLTVVYVFDDAAARTRTAAILATSIPRTTDVVAAANALELATADMMSDRTGGGVAELRAMLFSRGIELGLRRDFGADIERLKANSRSVRKELERHESIDVNGEPPVIIERKCQTVINEAALAGSLLITGEAGTGKTGVLNALGRELEARAYDVISLAVDQHSVESLEGLSGQLGLAHDLLSVLEGWDGAKPGWLIIDALDAARGGRGEEAFRALVAHTLRLDGRWNVVVTIRSYDLKQGRVFRSLFRGDPPSSELADQTLPRVRHVQVPAWSQAELDTICRESEGLAGALADAPAKLIELAHVPFNTRLIADLLSEKGIRAQLREVASQTQLLQLFWEHRVERHGIGGALCVFEVVKAVLKQGTLRAPLVDVGGHVEWLDALCSDGMLASDGMESVQFRHHVLFDYSAARFLMASGESLGGAANLGRARSSGLLLAPAFTFAMADRWERSLDRSAFWSLFRSVALDEAIDPVIRSAAARVGAEFPTEASDLRWFIDELRVQREVTSSALGKLCRSVAVLFEDQPMRSPEPWVWLVGELSNWVGELAGEISILLNLFIRGSAGSTWFKGVGRASRALLEHYQGFPDATFGLKTAIGFVADSYATDARESRRLLGSAFDPARFARFGFMEVPAICSRVKTIAAVDADFVLELYGQTYAHEVSDDSPTMMSGSEVLPLMSNAKQDFDMARYHLTEFFEEFLTSTPDTAAEAVCVAVERFVARQHPPPATASLHCWTVGDFDVRLQEDLSFVWAYDPDNAYGYDGDALIVTLSKVLRTCNETLALRIANRLLRTASLGVIWSRVFQAAARRGDGLLELMLPFAMEEPFLFAGDTRKDAIDVLAAGITRLPDATRLAFERRVFSFDFSRYPDEEAARSEVLLTLFSTIGVDQLISAEAIEWMDEAGDDRITASLNQRPFRLESEWRGRTSDPEDLRERYRDDPPRARVGAAIESARSLLGLASKDGGVFEGGFRAACEALEEVQVAVGQAGEVGQGLLEEAESTIVDGCLKLVAQGALPANEDCEGTRRFLELVTIACASASPVVGEKTDEAFAKTPSWSIPAVRVVAGELVPRTIQRRPDLLRDLLPCLDALLTDRHPAVRMKATLHLTGLGAVDRSKFWRRVEERSASETNVGVLQFLVVDLLGRLLHESPQRVEGLVLALAKRLSRVPGGDEGVEVALARKVAIIAVRYEGVGAQRLLDSWIEDPVGNERKLVDVTGTLREAYTWGLIRGGTNDDHRMRSRALGVASRIVQHAKLRLDAIGTSPDKASASRSLARIIDSVCSELYFSTGAAGNEDKDGPPPELGIFFEEVTPTLRMIAACAIPHSTYQLVEMLEFLLPLDPEGVFDVLADGLLAGGERARFKYESMGADVVVRIVGTLLADHRWVFEDDERRELLVRCLEVFVEVGWPSARRLMYGLPEMFH